MKFAHGFLLVLAALLSYFGLALLFGVYQRYPFAHMLLTVTGIMMMIAKIKISCSLSKLSATLFAVALLTFFVWWSQSYSTYRKPAQQAKGHISAEQSFGLKTTEGESFDFNAALKKSRRTLLVFNRGVW